MLSKIRKDLFKLDDSKITNVVYEKQCDISPAIMFPSYFEKQTHFNALIKHNNVVEFQSRKWSLDLFKEAKPPLIIDSVNSSIFSKRNADTYLWTMDLPIKMPRSDIRVPEEFSQFIEFVKKCFIHESITNPHLNDWYAYLCVDQRPVEYNLSQRRPGAHADSFPTGYVNMNRLSDSIYLCYDSLPTEFCLGDFTFNKNINTSSNADIFKHFETNTKNVKVYDCYHIIKLDSGHVHRVSFNNGSIKKTIDRTFIKVVFSPDIFNRIGNDHNYLFDYNWPLYQRSIERNNSSILDGYVINDSEFEYISFDKLHSTLFMNNCDWAENTVYNVRRKGYIHASPATEGELLMTNDINGNFMSCLVAKKDDWKIRNPITGSEYFIPTNKLIELYTFKNNNMIKTIDRPIKVNNLPYISLETIGTNGIIKKIKKNIKINAPWGSTQYLRKGDIIIKRHNGEIYGISKDDFMTNYEIIQQNE
jgi:hypothetical protein